MNVMVLTSGSWPLFGSRGSFIVPIQLQNCIHEFQKFYLNTNNGRRLNWLHHLCKGDLKMSKYEFQATNFQLSVLVLFNNHSVVSEKEIITATGIPQAEVRRTLKSLIDCRLLLVRKSTNNETGAPFITYTCNDKFVRCVLITFK